MNTTKTITQINEYIEADCPEIKRLYDICLKTSQCEDFPLKAMINTLDSEREESFFHAFGEERCLPLMNHYEDLSYLRELTGFISGFRVALRMNEWEKVRASKI